MVLLLGAQQFRFHVLLICSPNHVQLISSDCFLLIVQVPEFREMSQTVQMKLLKAATLSVLNVSAVFIFDADKQQWVVTTTDGQKRCFSVNDIVPLLEKLGHAEIGDYMLHYVRFHTELRHVFADDNVVLFTIVLLDLFSPNRFELHDPEMTAILSPIHAKYVLFIVFI